MKNKTAIFLLAAAATAGALAPAAQAGGVVIRIGASFGVPAPFVGPPPMVVAAPVVACAPTVPVYYGPPPVAYARPVYVAPAPVAVVPAAPCYVPPSQRFGYGYGLYGRPRYCGWY